MANKPGPQRALGSRGQTINADAWPYFDLLIRAVSVATGASYDSLITEATRTWARQNYLYVNRNKPGFNPAWPPDDARAYHVAGNAVDFGAGAGYRGTPVQKALHRLGPPLGIFFEISNELWHGAFDRRRAPQLAPASSATKPFVVPPLPLEEDNMTVMVVNTDTGTQFAVSREALHGFRNETDANEFRNVTSVQDELHRLNTAQLIQFLTGNGIPATYVYDEVFFKERGDARRDDNPEAWKTSRHADWSLQAEIRDRLVQLAKAGA